ncbi:hypothetical protein BC941DRAFT_468800 [Chlamydoabsidia padenii]|nr:hypothetical protein BC941DRAFT_468800 [Chlamydoabsidia padenii]
MWENHNDEEPVNRDSNSVQRDKGIENKIFPFFFRSSSQSILPLRPNAHLLIKSLVTEHDLDPATRIALSALSKVARPLGIQNTSWSSYQITLTNSIMNMLDLELEHQDLDELSWTITKQRKSAEQELVCLKELLENLRQERAEEGMKQVETWQTQTIKLQQQIKQDTSNVTKIDNVNVTSIRQIEQETNEREKQLDLVKQQLAQYYDLPCDMELASIKLQEKLTTMDTLKKDRDKLLAVIARSMY